MRALPFVAVALVVTALCVVAVVWINNRVDRARENRRERQRHEAFLDLLHKSAIDARDVETYAALVADQIRIHLSHSTPEKRRTR